MRNRSKVVVGLTAIAAVGIAAFLIVPSLASASTPVTTGSAPTHSPVPTADTEETDFSDGYVKLGHGIQIPEGGPGECVAASWIYIGSDDDGPMHAELLGPDLVDMGARDLAAGSVGMDNEGRIATYTVAPGDAEAAIGERFCIANGLTIGLLNGYSGGNAIQPGDVLVLRPDPAKEWIAPWVESSSS